MTKCGRWDRYDLRGDLKEDSNRHGTLRAQHPQVRRELQVSIKDHLNEYDEEETIEETLNRILPQIRKGLEYLKDK